MIKEHDPGRRDFLKKLGFLLGGAAVVAAGGKLLYDTLKEDEKSKEESNKAVNSLREKPIDLGYKEIVKDKDVDFVNSTGDKFSTLSRVSRCLRRKPVTDAVEDRYNIPRGLLMAMMAQEGMGDPTMPNLSGDGGLGLIHIQAINAHDFGLETLRRYTNGVRDTKHGKIIVDTLNNCNYDLFKLIEYDDRRHPIMAVDCAARFLMDCKRRAGAGTDDWIHALRYYSGRQYGGKGGYGIYVIKYRAIINDITGDGFPNNFSNNIYKDIKDNRTKNQSIKEKLNDIKFNIDGGIAGYEEYLTYFEESMQNFELDKYIALGEYTLKKKSEEPTKKEEENEEKKIKNTLITSEFVDTKQHNSEGFTLYRYKIKEGDTPLKISDKFDERDKQNGNKYKNTGNLNIVKRNGKKIIDIKEGDIVYIKAKGNK